MNRELEILKQQEQRFRQYNSKHSQDVIIELMRELKKNGNLKLDDASKIFHELAGLKRDTIDYVVQKIQYQIKFFGSKNVNYFLKAVQNMAAEPRRIFVSGRLKINI